MPTTNQNSIGSEVGRRLVKTIIAVVGLIVIRLILDNLPMLKEAKPIFVGGNGMATPNADWPRITQEYWNTGQLPQEVLQHAVGFIFPISIANAIVDTLIFAVLIGSAAGFNGLIRARSKRLPEGGLIILLLVLTIVVAIAYKSYMGVIPPLLGGQANLYGWFFLVLGLLPLIGLIVVASRNLDAITEVVFASTSRAAVGGVSQTNAAESSVTCSKCGAIIATGVKFCGSCGAPAPVSVSTGKFCSECGAKNESGAKFCNSCGKPLA
jgi:hypothetical protein